MSGVRDGEDPLLPEVRETVFLREPLPTAASEPQGPSNAVLRSLPRDNAPRRKTRISKRFVIWYLKYCALELPFIMALYIPYNVLWVHYSAEQLLRWASTAGVMYGVSSIVGIPWNHWIFRRIRGKPDA